MNLQGVFFQSGKYKYFFSENDLNTVTSNLKSNQTLDKDYW